VGDHLLRVLERAHGVLAKQTPTDVEKTIWGSPAGKKRIANRLAAMLPPHSTYVDPFAGSGAVLFAKEPAAVEAINDADLEIARAYKVVQKLRPRDFERLRDMDWVGDPGTFKGLIDEEPGDDLGWLHRFLYLTHFSYGKMRGKSFSPSSAGVQATTVDRLEQFAPRLRKVKVFGGDYRPVVEKFDGKDTVHFLDPPYPGYNVDVGESEFDEHAFVEMLKELEGKFLITYGIRGEFPKLVKEAGFDVRRIRTRRSIRSMRGVGGSSVLTQLLVSNYTLAHKSLDGLSEDGWELDDERAAQASVPVDLEAPTAPVFASAGTLLKGVDPGDERFVLGIVLEPEVVDAQGDIYSPEEIRKAAHLFMQEFGGLGLMHRIQVNDQVKVLESFLAPTDFELGGITVKKGTWMLGVRVLSDALWEQVKSGALTGFSIGGSARRVPEPSVAHTPPPPEDLADAH
jgi:DNA adenine methylase